MKYEGESDREQIMEKRRMEKKRERRRECRIWLHYESVEGTAENVIRDRWRVFGSGCVYYCIYTLCYERTSPCVFVFH